MLLITGKGINWKSLDEFHKYSKVNEYMKNIDENKDSSCVMYLDKNNLYEKTVLSKSLLNGMKYSNIIKMKLVKMGLFWKMTWIILNG